MRGERGGRIPGASHARPRGPAAGPRDGGAPLLARLAGRAAHIALALSLALTTALAGDAMATDSFRGEPLRVTATADWPRVELHEDRSPLFVREPFSPAARQDEPDVVLGFGGDEEPPSSRFLLHAATGFDAADDGRPPVLLVHGAVVDATTSWGRASFRGRGGAGLAARLAGAGRRVFAVTFAHPHGCNFLWAEQLANAIARVRSLTGASKVDLVAHSKGGIAARIYCSDVRRPGMTRYRGDVRRLLLLGVPNGGIDVAFAYPNLNYWVIHHKASAPLSWTEALCYGLWTDLRKESLYAPPDGLGAYPGQAQMLARWDGTYGLYEADPMQFDVRTTYEGGRGRVSISLGIEEAIAQGGGLIARLEKAGVARGVEVALLAGTKPYVMGFLGERRGPSDGLLLVRSALATDGLARSGAKVLRADTLHLSHVELAFADPAFAWVEEALGR